MKRAILPILLVLSVAAVAQQQPAPSQVPGLPIGAGLVTLHYTVVNLDGNIDAFIPTGSDSPICLVTFGDGNIYGSGPSPAICAPRTFNDTKGVRIVVIPYFSAFTTPLILNLTVYQLGAHGYGEPVPFTED